jgi:hypothetical protein
MAEVELIDIENSEIASESSSKLPTILDGKYFKVLEVQGRKVKAVCNFCPKYSVFEGFTSPTSNFSTHLKVINQTDISLGSLKQLNFCFTIFSASTPNWWQNTMRIRSLKELKRQRQQVHPVQNHVGIRSGT